MTERPIELGHALDFVWRADDRDTAADQAASKISELDRSILEVWCRAAQSPYDPIGASAVRLSDGGIQLLSKNRSPLDLAGTDCRTSASHLLRAAQLIRDHMESALLLPPDLRRARLSSFAAVSKQSHEAFSRLVSWFPTFQDLFEVDRTA